MASQAGASISARIAMFERGVGNDVPAASAVDSGPSSAKMPSSRSKVLQVAAKFDTKVRDNARADVARPAKLQTERVASFAKMAKAMAVLEDAFACLPCDVPKMHAAIQHARNAGIFTYKINEYLRTVEQLEETIKRLQIAVEDGWESSALEEIVEEAKRLNIAGTEYEAACTKVAELQLSDAVQSKNLALLEARISHARKICLEASLLAEADAQLRELLHGRALRQLESAFERKHLSWIEQAIEEGRAHLQTQELADALRRLATLRLFSASSAAASMPVSRHVESLRCALQHAREVRSEEEESLGEAEVLLAWAESNMQEEVCDICFEPCETHAMRCCVRDTGGGRMCDACMARLLQAGSKCPFCRGHIH